MELVQGDVTSLSSLPVGEEFRLVLDTGTFHDFGEKDRLAIFVFVFLRFEFFVCELLDQLLGQVELTLFEFDRVTELDVVETPHFVGVEEPVHRQAFHGRSQQHQLLAPTASIATERHLSRVANVRTRVIGEYDYGWMRLSTHVYNNPGEIERVLVLLADVARNGIPA